MNDRKLKVLEASLVLFTEKGFQNTSIQDIIQRANISKGTFYNYFSSKNECFVAILEKSRYEASLRRHELLIGQDKTNLDLLAQQISVLMKINQEQNLIPLFEGIFQSSDQELISYLTKHRLHEVQWMMARLIDVYGEEARPYVYEAAIIFFGMIQHLAFSYRMTYKVAADPLQLSQTGLRHLNVVLPNMIAAKKVFLTTDAIQLYEHSIPNEQMTKEDITKKLADLHARTTAQDVTNGQQFTTVLIEEFTLEELRPPIIEALVKPFRDAFLGTELEIESREIAHFIWSYLTQWKKDKVHG